MKDEQLVTEWLEECRTQSTRQLYTNNIRLFQEWYAKPLQEFLDLDPKAMRHEALKFQSYLAERFTKRKALMTANSIISALTALGSFCTFNDKTLNLRGKRLRTRIDLSSHVFTNGELGRLFDIASVEEKAILATFCSLGWEVSSLLELKRDYIASLIKQAKEENKRFIFFQGQRPKTGALRLGVLNPLAIEWLGRWIEQSSGERPSGERLFRFTTKEGVNFMVKRLAREAHITKTGRIHTHLIRKWVMSGLSRAGFNEFQIKYVLGKAIPLSDLTYLQTLQQEIETKYPAAYEYVNIKPEKVILVPDETLKLRVQEQAQRISELERSLAQLAVTASNEAIKDTLENQGETQTNKALLTEIKELRDRMNALEKKA